MDPIEILGSILGQKSSGGGMGADILKEIFKGATGGGGPGPQAQPRSAPPTSPVGKAAPRPTSGDDLERQARELEDLLNVAKNRSTQRPGEAPRQPQPPAQPRQPQQPQSQPRDAGARSQRIGFVE